MAEHTPMSQPEHHQSFKVGDRVRIVKLITIGVDPDLGLDRYADKVGEIGTIHDVTYLYGSDLDVYRLRFDSHRGSVLLDPFYADEIEAVQS